MSETIQCGICWDVFEYDKTAGMTAGFYVCTEGSAWAAYSPDHDFLCDHCMWSTAAYRKVYGVQKCSAKCKKPHYTSPLAKWQTFGEQASVSYEVMADVGRALMGVPPRYHEWIKFNENRTAYQVGPHVAEEPQS